MCPLYSTIALTEALADGFYLRLDGANDPMQANLDMGGYQVVNLDKLLLSGTKEVKGQDAGTVYISPFSDISRAFEVRKSDGVTAMMSFDMVTDDVGFGVTLPQEPIHVYRNENNNQGIRMENAYVGNAAVARIFIKADSASMSYACYSSAFTSVGSKKADGGQLFTSNNASGGLSIVARAPGATLRLYAGGNSDADEHLTLSENDLALRSGFPFYFDGLTRTKSLKWNSTNGAFEFNDDVHINADNISLLLGAGLDMSVYYSGSVGYIDTSLVAASDLMINCGTDKTLEIVETVWEDLRVPLTSGRLGATNPPTLSQFMDDGAGSVGVYVYAFSYEAVESNEEQMWFVAQLPHAYKQGTNVLVHIHWSPAVSGAANEFVKWGLEYTWQNIDGTFGNTTIITSDASSASTATTSGDTTLTADKHYVTKIGTITGTGKNISSILVCRIFRNSSHGDDDLAQDAFGFEVDFHFEVNTMGSRQELVK